jgi:hypothetical protein
MCMEVGVPCWMVKYGASQKENNYMLRLIDELWWVKVSSKGRFWSGKHPSYESMVNHLRSSDTMA